MSPRSPNLGICLIVLLALGTHAVRCATPNLDSGLAPIQPGVGEITPAVEGDLIAFRPGVAIQVLRDGQRFLGLGRITIDGVELRSGKTPMTLLAVGAAVAPSDLTGVAMPALHENLLIQKISLAEDGAGADIILDGQIWQRPADRLVISLRGESEDWRSARSAGFSYSFRFEGQRGSRIHQLRETSSWSLGGTVNGRLSIDQNEAYGKQSHALVLRPDTVIKPWSFPAQRLWPESRFAVGDFMDFLSAANICFIRYLDRPALSYREISRPANSDELCAREWYPTEAAGKFQTAPMHVRLYHAGGINAWLDARDLIRARYVKQSGIEPTPLVPGVINNLASMTLDTFGKQYLSVAEPRPYIDWLQGLGIRRQWIWSRWKTAWTAWPTMTQEDRDAIQTALSHAVMRLELDDAVVDLPRLKELVTYGNQHGLESMMWMPGGHLSKVSPLRRENPSWVVKTLSGEPYTYVYPDIGGNNYAAGYGQYMLDALAAVRKQVPFTGIWLDSFQVFGLDVIDYGKPGWPNNFDAAVDFVRRARQAGLSVGSECAFPLAMPSSTGFYRTEEMEGREFLAYGLSQHFGGAEPKVMPQLYFRLLAWNAPPLLLDRHWKESPELTEKGTYANKAFAALQPVMKRPRLLPDGLGVLWLDENDQPAAVWAFADGQIDLGGQIQSANDPVTGAAASAEGGRLRIAAEAALRVITRPPSP